MAVARPGGAAEVREIVAAHLPGYPIDSVVPAGAGLDHRVYEVNGELIVRLRRTADPDLLDREVRLLAALTAIAPLPVPEPAFAVAELGCLAYLRLPGTPLSDLPPAERSDHAGPIAAALGRLLTALHAVPVAQVAGLVDLDNPPVAEWRREAAATYPRVAGQVPPDRRRLIEAFLDTPPPAGGDSLVFSHNDLGIEHVLVDPVTWTVTGIIDWSDAAIADPARDFGLLHRDLGPAALPAATAGYPAGGDDLAALRERAVFYARCKVLEDLAYGLQTGRGSYYANSLAAMEWLFPG